MRVELRREGAKQGGELQAAVHLPPIAAAQLSALQIAVACSPKQAVGENDRCNVSRSPGLQAALHYHHTPRERVTLVVLRWEAN